MIRNRIFWSFSLILITLLAPSFIYSQSLNKINITSAPGLCADSLTLSDSTVISLARKKPLFSFLLNEKNYTALDQKSTPGDSTFSMIVANQVKVIIHFGRNTAAGWRCDISFENISSDTVSVGNVVPFGIDDASVTITGRGPADLARAWLSRPGFHPVRVILPDNAWELGYSSFDAGKGYSVCAIARRGLTEGGRKQRYETSLPPKAVVHYTLRADVFRGEWQEGLRLMFRDRYLYDLEKFDNTLYERPDLAWIRESYLIILQMAWDREFYDRMTGKYTFPELLRSGLAQFGKIDVYGIWPTWPRLGLDQRNQWDLYRDLPGGTTQLKSFAQLARQSGTRFFIAYNPWDSSTRKEDHYRGMARLINEVQADGVVLDTKGSSSYEIQAAADSVRKGVVMYSEGMAIVKDMPGIISGRVHNAIYLSPELNLNKLIKPGFSIFRVCDIGEDLIHREIAVSFFNGYGTELNMYRPGGRDDDYRADIDFLARTTFILRQNNDAFLDNDWTPLIETRTDGAYVNRWKSGGKTLFTVLNMKPEGIDGNLFRVHDADGAHFVSLWHHENIMPVIDNGITFLPARAPGWPKYHAGTRREGSVDCIAGFPDILQAGLNGDSISFNTRGKGKVVLWKGNPSYRTDYKELVVKSDTTVRIKDLFGYYEGKIVLQLLENNILVDENIVKLEGGAPWLITKTTLTEPAEEIPGDMVLVPGTEFSFKVSGNDDFITYPDISDRVIAVDSFLIDRYPVTNEQYFNFLTTTGYRPADTLNYLRHWREGTFRQGQERYPVVYLSLEDAKAYAKWAGKRLPTEAEWQLAAQGTDKRKWPWGNEFHATFCNNAFNRLTPVDAFPKGQSPFAVMDLVGNIWQMTNDIYFNGSYYMMIIRGGSYYKPDSSWWYIQGGPQPLDKTQIMLLVSPGFDRNATVGFRCVKDLNMKTFKTK